MDVRAWVFALDASDGNMSLGTSTATERAIYDKKCTNALCAYAACHPRARRVVDVSHTRCTQACKLWNQPRTSAFVCTHSLRVHLCGDECRLPQRDADDNDVKVCLLTNMIVGHQTYTQTPSFDESGRAHVHWKQTRMKKSERAHLGMPVVPRARKKDRLRALRRCVAACLGPRRHRDASVVKNSMRKQTQHTFATIASCTHKAHIPRPISKELMACATGLIADVIHNHMVRNAAMKQGSIDTAVAVLLTLMSTGWVVLGYVIVPRVPFVANYLPTPMLMGSVPKVQCRGISVGVRAFKRYAVTSTGTPITNRAVEIPTKTYHALQRIEVGLPPSPRH